MFRSAAAADHHHFKSRLENTVHFYNAPKERWTQLECNPTYIIDHILWCSQKQPLVYFVLSNLQECITDSGKVEHPSLFDTWSQNFENLSRLVRIQCCSERTQNGSGKDYTSRVRQDVRLHNNFTVTSLHLCRWLLFHISWMWSHWETYWNLSPLQTMRGCEKSCRRLGGKGQRQIYGIGNVNNEDVYIVMDEERL